MSHLTGKVIGKTHCAGVEKETRMMCGRFSVDDEKYLCPLNAKPAYRLAYKKEGAQSIRLCALFFTKV